MVAKLKIRRHWESASQQWWLFIYSLFVLNCSLNMDTTLCSVVHRDFNCSEATEAVANPRSGLFPVILFVAPW